MKKKKIASIAAAGLLVLSGGLLLAGCGGPSQETMHQMFQQANVAMKKCADSITIVDTYKYRNGDEKPIETIESQLTYNAETHEYAYIEYNDDGSIEDYSAVKKYQDGTLGYHSQDGNEITDEFYAARQVSREISYITYDVEETYEQYVAELNEDAEEEKADLIEDGWIINHISYTLKYKQLGGGKYEFCQRRKIDVQSGSDFEGKIGKLDYTVKFIFTENHILSIEDSEDYYYREYKGGPGMITDRSSCYTEQVTLAYDSSILDSLELNETDKPTEYMTNDFYAYLDGEEVGHYCGAPIMTDVESLINEYVDVEVPENCTLKAYLDEAMTLPMPEGYKINSTDLAIVYFKIVPNEGYAYVKEEIWWGSSREVKKEQAILATDNYQFNNVLLGVVAEDSITINGTEFTGGNCVIEEGNTYVIKYVKNDYVTYCNDITVYVGESMFDCGGYAFCEGRINLYLKELIAGEKLPYANVDLSHEGLVLKAYKDAELTIPYEDTDTFGEECVIYLDYAIADGYVGANFYSNGEKYEFELKKYSELVDGIYSINYYFDLELYVSVNEGEMVKFEGETSDLLVAYDEDNVDVKMEDGNIYNIYYVSK